MKCINCGSEWNATGKAAVSITNCPFCGESPVVKKTEQKAFEASKETLEAIYKQFGADILLGKLNAYIADFAPSLSTANKRLVNSVYEFGASKALKESINGTQEDKERAVKIAIRNMTEAHVSIESSETIIYEFTDALGWKIEKEKSLSTTQDTTKKPVVNNDLAEAINVIKKQDRDNYKKVRDILNESALQGNAEAMYWLGKSYMGKKGILSQFPEALKWIRKAAVNGFADAQYDISKEYDGAKRIEWLRKAAEQGYIDAQLVLAESYYEGSGTRKNYTEAIIWFRKAADQGSSEAQYFLGSCYEEGNGVKLNYAQAAEWYQKAADQGDKNAKEELKELKKLGKI